MSRKNPFKHHRFPAGVILCAVRLYLRYPFSYADTCNLLEERGVHVDKKYKNNRIESDHAALKRLLRRRKRLQAIGFRKATLKGIEAIRFIKLGSHSKY